MALPAQSRFAARIALNVHLQVALQETLTMPTRITVQTTSRQAFRTTFRTVPGTVPGATREASLQATCNWMVTITHSSTASYSGGSKKAEILEQILLPADIHIGEEPRPQNAPGP